MFWFLCFLACTVGFGASIAHFEVISVQSCAAGCWVSALIIMVGAIVQLMFQYLAVPGGISGGDTSRLQALRIVEGEMDRFREGILPNSMVIWQDGGDVKTHDLLIGFETRMKNRIKSEC